MYNTIRLFMICMLVIVGAPVFASADATVPRDAVSAQQPGVEAGGGISSLSGNIDAVINTNTAVGSNESTNIQPIFELPACALENIEFMKDYNFVKDNGYLPGISQKPTKYPLTYKFITVKQDKHYYYQGDDSQSYKRQKINMKGEMEMLCYEGGRSTKNYNFPSRYYMDNFAMVSFNGSDPTYNSCGRPLGIVCGSTYYGVRTPFSIGHGDTGDSNKSKIYFNDYNYQFGDEDKDYGWNKAYKSNSGILLVGNGNNIIYGQSFSYNYGTIIFGDGDNTARYNSYSSYYTPFNHNEGTVKFGNGNNYLEVGDNYGKFIIGDGDNTIRMIGAIGDGGEIIIGDGNNDISIQPGYTYGNMRIGKGNNSIGVGSYGIYTEIEVEGSDASVTSLSGSFEKVSVDKGCVKSGRVQKCYDGEIYNQGYLIGGGRGNIVNKGNISVGNGNHYMIIENHGNLDIGDGEMYLELENNSNTIIGNSGNAKVNITIENNPNALISIRGDATIWSQHGNTFCYASINYGVMQISGNVNFELNGKNISLHNYGIIEAKQFIDGLSSIDNENIMISSLAFNNAAQYKSKSWRGIIIDNYNLSVAGNPDKIIKGIQNELGLKFSDIWHRTDVHGSNGDGTIKHVYYNDTWVYDSITKTISKEIKGKVVKITGGKYVTFSKM